MVELLTKGNWIKLNLWQKLLVGIIDTKVATVIHKLCERIIKLYLRHAGSIILSNDQSRFIFTSDMTELEFMLNNWLESAVNNKSKLLLKPGLKQSLVIDFSDLKVFRRLIFTETKELKSTLKELEKLPIQVVIPHFLTRLTPRFTIFQASDLSPQAYSSNVDKLYKDEIKGFYQKAMKSKMTIQYREKLKDLELEEIDKKNNELVFELVEGFLN
ncbi:hypothetical protein CONCODRAFT_4304 [Conidiobolus coronatus NRRL 28638]|uniref:Uncharacterized protein n=1 Tax=Conidiobolus coronatus (strain ATCC 28846 / CBS 209.66 / NRRL 28638) TaxID=796925 RepID=A0A137PCT0_CONC2|nr:hypothetical protein CONCODRAFT_4304 [Conidiobolus coronatus NRRL 28638]|eukprot:KXN72808.1 hypothetical protein CONCODRAFT_4304 [Conidiobolus coronatus NRRL 28638]